MVVDRWDNGKAPVLVSGAGHDALPMSNITKVKKRPLSTFILPLFTFLGACVHLLCSEQCCHSSQHCYEMSATGRGAQKQHACVPLHNRLSSLAVRSGKCLQGDCFVLDGVMVPQMGMLFVRDRGGISHSPLEFVADEDIAAAGAALYMYLNAECT